MRLRGYEGGLRAWDYAEGAGGGIRTGVRIGKRIWV